MGTKGETTFQLTDPEALRALGANIHPNVDRLDGHPSLSESGSGLKGLKIGTGTQFRGRINLCLRDGDTVDVTIGAGAILKDVVLHNHVVVGAGASVSDCTVLPNTNIPEGMEITGPGEIGPEDMPQI